MTNSPSQTSPNMSLGALLEEFVPAAGAINALIITRDGTRIAEGGNVAGVNTTALAALVAAMFSATREVARMVGEDHFSLILQQGEKRHIHISLINEATMMLVVFEDYQRIGRVRLEAKKVAEKVAANLAARRPVTKADVDAPVFREYALGLIDALFTERDPSAPPKV